MRRSAFGNLSGFGLTGPEHAVAMSVEAEKLNAVFRALDKSLARGVPACAKSLRLLTEAATLYGLMAAHGYSGGMPVARAYKDRMAELVPKTIAACAKK